MAAILINGDFQNVNGVHEKTDTFLPNLTEVARIIIKLVLFPDELSNSANFSTLQEAKREDNLIKKQHKSQN